MTQRTFTRVATQIALLCILTCVGCGKPEQPSKLSAAEHARRAAANDSTTLRIDPRKLREQLGVNEMATFVVEGNDIVEANLFRSGLRSVAPLKGVPLRVLDLGFTFVSDLSPLSGMPLESLVLEDTDVADLSMMKGMPLKVLKIQNTKVTDFGFLDGMKLTHFNVLNLPFSDLNTIRDMPMNTLWLTGSKVTDLGALSGSGIVSLDIERTEVIDLTPLTTMSRLKRLNIANTPVTDLRPLAGLNLERIVLSPEKIRTGIEAIRNMKSLVYVQTSVTQDQTAEEFWKRYDLGIWDDSKPTSQSEPEPATEAPATGAPPSSQPETKTP